MAKPRRLMRKSLQPRALPFGRMSRRSTGPQHGGCVEGCRCVGSQRAALPRATWECGGEERVLSIAEPEAREPLDKGPLLCFGVGRN